MFESEHLCLEEFFLGYAFELRNNRVKPIQEIHLQWNVFGHVVLLIVEVMSLSERAQISLLEAHMRQISLVFDEIHQLAQIRVHPPLL